jgi:hypothetical protein
MDKQADLDGSLDALDAARAALGRNGDPLEPVSLRTAAFVVAVERVAHVALERGISP